MRSSSEVLSRSPKIARRAGIAFSFIRIVYHAAGSRPLLRRTLLRLRRTHLLREGSRNRQFLRRVCAPKRKARHADGRSGAAGRRGGTVRFSNTNLVTNQLGGPRRVNEERGRAAEHVHRDAGEPKARARTELPEARRPPLMARAPRA